ncbi:glycoside hydrolase domain-containing protein [Bacillus canaveralius]|uniref:glycoside hydrolase domain-containing protein n=1 Tax=Bacillus canaveralius TaxID=1403243 RepID=UPI000F787083|nr:glycoside hydrolase domain-containing protein [Bacillus canaveralius]RSK43109.1 DUF1906 domain-containing protein [Bacillus canaveralius]
MFDGDVMVYEVQRWVNSTYQGMPGFIPAPENGKTGWSTMYALTRALQIEFGLTPVDNFGNGTAQAFRNWGEMELGKVPDTLQGQRIVRILQGGMFCKGYNPGGFTGTFGEGTKNAVIKLQTDANLPARDGKVYDYVFKAFLVMDAYVLMVGGDLRVREIQRDLNYYYFSTAGVQPCDGHYQRGTNRALIYGIQTEEGIPASQQTGAVGPSTTDRLPTLSVGSSGNFVKLFQFALYLNNFDPGAFNSQYDTSVKTTVIEFQKFTILTPDGVAGKQTWLSLLQSKGDPNRKGTACDCSTMIDLAKAQALKSAGNQTVGRYLTNVPGGLNKKIQPGELDNIFNAGLTVFPIFQTFGDDIKYFSRAQGKKAAGEAYNAARNYGFKRGTTIYFAVDFDAYGHHIENETENDIVDHFRGINEQMAYLGNYYKVGVYGPRAVCIKVSEKGYASTSFVSGMSTGYSGNLGYPLPNNWAFDQISTVWVGSGDGRIQIDNNIKSGRDNGQSSVEVPYEFNQEFFRQLNQFHNSFF